MRAFGFFEPLLELEQGYPLAGLTRAMAGRAKPNLAMPNLVKPHVPYQTLSAKPCKYLLAYELINVQMNSGHKSNRKLNNISSTGVDPPFW